MDATDPTTLRPGRKTSRKNRPAAIDHDLIPGVNSQRKIGLGWLGQIDVELTLRLTGALTPQDPNVIAVGKLVGPPRLRHGLADRCFRSYRHHLGTSHLAGDGNSDEGLYHELGVLLESTKEGSNVRLGSRKGNAPDPDRLV